MLQCVAAAYHDTLPQPHVLDAASVVLCTCVDTLQPDRVAMVMHQIRRLVAPAGVVLSGWRKLNELKRETCGG